MAKTKKTVILNGGPLNGQTREAPKQGEYHSEEYNGMTVKYGPLGAGGTHLTWVSTPDSVKE